MDLFFVFATSLLLAVLNQLHVILQWFARPAGTYFTGIAHYFTDYFLYTDIMAQGAAGNLWTAAHFTNESVAKTWIYWFNALLGWLGNLVGLSPFATYNVSLFLLVIVLCLVWYKLTKMLYPTRPFLRITSWFIILTASSFYWKGELLGQFWFSPAPAFNRLGGVPHQVFQTILFVLLALTYTRKKIQIFPVLLLTGLAASANPIQMVLFVAAACVLRSARVIPIMLVAIPVMLATNKAFELPVLAAAKAWENAQQVSVSLWQFILSMGPIALLIPFGVRPFLKEKTPLRILLFSYSALSILIFFSPIPKLFATANVRWLHPASYAVLGILAAEGMMAIFKFSKKSFLVIGHWILVIGYLSLTVPSLYVQINARANTSELNHVPMTVVDALTSLKNSARPGVVLTDPALPYDVLVPTFTGSPSFTGHPIHTLYPSVKESLRRDFFSRKMTPDQQKQFLSDHRIRYIITKENGSIKISTHE